MNQKYQALGQTNMESKKLLQKFIIEIPFTFQQKIYKRILCFTIEY